MDSESLPQVLAGSPLLRNFLIMVPCLGLGIFIAANIDTDSWTFSVILLVSLFLTLLFGILTKYARFEAVVLGLLLIGYLVGNRGFAQLTIYPPFYIGEVSLAALIICYLLRYVISRETIHMRSPLGAFILIYLAAGIIRFSFDVSFYRLDAARDLALVYYSLFFFAAYQLGRQPESRRFLEQCLVFGFVGLAVLETVLAFLPDTLVSDENFGIFLYEKGDLLGAFAVAGIFFVYIRPNIWGSRFLRLIVLLILSASVVLGIARSAIIAVILASSLFWIAGFRLFFANLAVTTLAAIVVILCCFATLNVGVQNDYMIDFAEKMISIVDFSSEYHYQSELGALKAANNDFRRFFWQSIIQETNADNPLVGKGFGYDFLTRFEQSYNRGHWEGLRSPHNYYVTIYGRMGIMGLLIFGAITFLIVRGSMKAAAQVRRGLMDQKILAYWCCAWTVLVASCVGVVLESPVGAIVFWSFLGLAVSGSEEVQVESPAAALARPQSGAALIHRGRLEHARSLRRPV